MLAYDIITHLRQWIHNRERSALFESLYSLAIVIYLILGSIEQAGLVTDWMLVVFRIFYAATFLFVYVLVMQEEIANENYWLEGNPTAII